MSNPEDYESMNAWRAAAAGDAVESFAASTYLTNADGDDIMLRDLLANLMHWADRQGLNFDNELHYARDHYGVEKAEEENEDDN